MSTPLRSPWPARRTLPHDEQGRELAIQARHLHLKGKRGIVYGPLDLDIPAGSLSVLTGREGSGKTSMLLTLTGRMKPTKGSELTVLGYELPARAMSVQRRSAAMGVAGLDDLDEEVTVGACVRERQAWLSPGWKWLRNPDDRAVQSVCARTFGDLPIPSARRIVHELPEASNLLLRIALALMSQPALIVVDEIDQLHDIAERDLVWQRLGALAAQGTTVITACASPRELDRLDVSTTPLIIELPEHDTASLAEAAGR